MGVLGCLGLNEVETLFYLTGVFLNLLLVKLLVLLAEKVIVSGRVKALLSRVVTTEAYHPRVLLGLGLLHLLGVLLCLLAHHLRIPRNHWLLACLILTFLLLLDLDQCLILLLLLRLIKLTGLC